jgi:peptidoglycan hydrolase FlgJ
MSMDKFTSDTALALLNSTSSHNAQATERLKNAAQAHKAKQIEDAAEDFEAVFLTEMMKPIFESVEVDKIFGGGKGEEVFRSFMVQEYGKIMAASGQIGLASPVKDALIKMQSDLDNQSQPQHTPQTITGMEIATPQPHESHDKGEKTR